MLLPDAAYEVESVQWSVDGKSLFFIANLGIHNELMRVEVATKQVNPLTSDEHNLAGWSFVGSAGLRGSANSCDPSSV